LKHSITQQTLKTLKESRRYL